MAWLEPISTAVTVASLAKEFVDSSGILKKYTKRFVYLIKNGKAVIPVFGSGGVGKTTMGRIITDENPLDAATPYEESMLVDRMIFDGDVPGSLLVAPGQIARAERHWPELLKQVAVGKCFGVINVVCYGYHSFSLQSFRDHDIYQDGMIVKDFLIAYTEKRRQIEIDLLKKIVDGLAAIKQPLWFLTIVNKQDLWWDRRIAVKKHYDNGEYSNIIDTLTKSLGSRNFQHEFIPMSFTIGNWLTNTGELISPTIGGYDQALHLQHMQMMFDKLSEFIEQGRPI
jgi:hypothetical protein